MSLELTPEIRAEIAADLLKTRAPSRTAKNLGYTINLVLRVAEEENKPRSQFVEQYGGNGRPDMLPYFVARKKAWEAWDNTIPEIADARASYERGTHTMITGRDGDWLILYCIQQKTVTPRPNYWLSENSL